MQSFFTLACLSPATYNSAPPHSSQFSFCRQPALFLSHFSTFSLPLILHHKLSILTVFWFFYLFFLVCFFFFFGFFWTSEDVVSDELLNVQCCHRLLGSSAGFSVVSCACFQRQRFVRSVPAVSFIPSLFVPCCQLQLHVPLLALYKHLQEVCKGSAGLSSMFPLL